MTDEPSFDELADLVAHLIVSAPAEPEPAPLTISELETLVQTTRAELKKAERTVMCPPGMEDGLRRAVWSAGLDHLISVEPTHLLEGEDHVLVIPNRVAQFDLPPPGTAFGGAEPAPKESTNPIKGSSLEG